MNIMDKMKLDWNRRAREDARYWIATEAYETEEMFGHSGQRDSARLLQGLDTYRDAGWRILEIGCGVGRMLKPLARSFAELWGVDVSREMIARSKDWLRDLQNVQTLENNGLDLHEFPADHFDLVFSYVAFQHMPKEVFEGYLIDSHRVLKPQGLLKFQVYLGKSTAPPIEDTITLRSYSESELLTLLDLSGFSVIDQTLLIRQTISGIALGNYYITARAQDRQTLESRKTVQDLYTRTCRDIVSTTDIRMRLMLIKRHVKSGRYAQAIPLLQEHLKRYPDHVEPLQILIKLLVMTGRFPEAIQTAKTLMHTCPDDTSCSRLLATLERTMGDLNDQRPLDPDLKQQLEDYLHSPRLGMTQTASDRIGRE